MLCAVSLCLCSFKFSRIRDLYPHFEYSDLVKHRAIVLIPYQVSIMSLFEYYRMCIPLFVPSTALLAKWQVRRGGSSTCKDNVRDMTHMRSALASCVAPPAHLRQLKHRVMDERTWSGVYKRFKRSSAIAQHPDSHVPHDPNNEFDAEAIQCVECAGFHAPLAPAQYPNLRGTERV